ncbi:DUF2242 domain-containing protein [Pseudomonas fluorescens]|uniref:Lipoprotein n=1 Tax=Pseudomonas fluorescens TaxID=294 RepID=A0A5E7FF54_PSEFL|nr:DUF2242 domain-containing protein [Pseudomonas fluorescens]VVO37786.1 hypothetical protein PS723_05529 [Pseudomonas fluorescens]
MFKSLHMRFAVMALVMVGAAGCSEKKAAIYEHEDFADSGTFSRNYPVSDAATCEAARRALLSQGYIITSSDPKLISGHKSFQQTGDSHMEISFNVVCAEDGSAGHHATMFANALQDRYALKKTNNSASLGVGVLGSVSMPIGSSDDSMVKVASETVSSAKFYERFFALVELFLPPEAKKIAHITEKPKTVLGVPEAQAAPAPAPEPEPAPTVPEPGAAPAAPPTEPANMMPAENAPASEPVAPPADNAPIAPEESAEPASSNESTAPPANPDSLPPPTEPISSMPVSAQ